MNGSLQSCNPSVSKIEFVNAWETVSEKKEKPTKRKALIVSVSILLIVVVGLIFFSRSDSRVCTKRAQNLISSLQAGEYENAERDFNSRLSEMFTPEILGRTWAEVIAKYGPLEKQTITHTEALNDRDDSYLVCFTCDFERGRTWGLLVFDKTRHIRMLSLSESPQEFQSAVSQVKQPSQR